MIRKGIIAVQDTIPRWLLAYYENSASPRKVTIAVGGKLRVQE